MDQTQSPSLMPRISIFCTFSMGSRINTKDASFNFPRKKTEKIKTKKQPGMRKPKAYKSEKVF